MGLMSFRQFTLQLYPALIKCPECSGHGHTLPSDVDLRPARVCFRCDGEGWVLPNETFLRIMKEMGFR